MVAGVDKRSPLTSDGGEGCYKCKGCHCCPIIRETTTFSSTNTQKKYKIKKHLTCDSSYVVYLVTCTRCKGQYVGKSVTPFKRRHSNHKQEIRKKLGGLGQHYGGDRACSYADVSITIIEQFELGNRAHLAKREQYWQHQLCVFVENGGNAHTIRKDFEK